MRNFNRKNDHIVGKVQQSPGREKHLQSQSPCDVKLHIFQSFIVSKYMAICNPSYAKLTSHEEIIKYHQMKTYGSLWR